MLTKPEFSRKDLLDFLEGFGNAIEVLVSVSDDEQFRNTLYVQVVRPLKRFVESYKNMGVLT